MARGNSGVAVAAIAGIEENTASSMLAESGDGYSTLPRIRIRGFKVSHLEIEEVWRFVRKEQRRVTAADPEWAGDAYC